MAVGAAVDVILDRTPFYAESGGQAADTGYLSSSSSNTDLQVTDVQKGAGGRLFVHKAVLQQGSLSVGQQVGHRWTQIWWKNALFAVQQRVGWLVV